MQFDTGSILLKSGLRDSDIFYSGQSSAVLQHVPDLLAGGIFAVVVDGALVGVAMA